MMMRCHLDLFLSPMGAITAGAIAAATAEKDPCWISAWFTLAVRNQGPYTARCTLGQSKRIIRSQVHVSDPDIVQLRTQTVIAQNSITVIIFEREW
jgi:hypothetical protein